MGLLEESTYPLYYSPAPAISTLSVEPADMLSGNAATERTAEK